MRAFHDREKKSTVSQLPVPLQPPCQSSGRACRARPRATVRRYRVFLRGCSGGPWHFRWAPYEYTSSSQSGYFCAGAPMLRGVSSRVIAARTRAYIKESIMSNRLSSPLFTCFRAVLMSLIVTVIAIPKIDGGWWG